MFYTKYRPQRFSELFGLESVTKAITNALKSNQHAHAYFFFGPKGTGKTTMARLLAKALNCHNQDRSKAEPCCQCESCLAITEGRSLDLIEMDAASNRSIDDIRELKEKIKLVPTASKYKIYIIDEVHMLTQEAFNALLKTLEEPPKHAVFVLCTTESRKVPLTIRSRCQIFEFKRARIKDIVAKLKYISGQENLEISDKQLLLIAQNASGGFRDAETLLEQVATGGQDIWSLVGINDVKVIEDFSSLLADKEYQKAVELINKLFDQGMSLPQFTKDLIFYLRDLLLIKKGLGEELIETSEEEYQKMVELAKKLEAKQLMLMLERFGKTEQDLKWSPIPTLPLELVIFGFEF